MINVIFCLVLIVGCFAAKHHEASIDKIFQDIDTNGNQEVTETELETFFLGFEHHTHAHGGVNEHDFIHQWTKHYHMENIKAEMIYVEIDQHTDGVLDTLDFQMLLKKMDDNGDGLCNEAEFKKFLNFVYEMAELAP